MRVIVAGENAARRNPLRQALLGAGLECWPEDSVALPGLPARLAQVSADLVCVVCEPIGPALGAIEWLTAQDPTVVLAAGPADSQCILQALRAGARAYLDEANLRDDLQAALDKLGRDGVTVPMRGRLVAVIAAHPGSGVTTVSASLAFALAEQHPGQVVLAELGAGVPELALDLDLQPRHSVSDLAALWDHMDVTLVRQALVQHPAGLSILAHKPETLQVAPLVPAAMRQTAVLLRTMFGTTVLDLGHTADAAVLEALTLADAVIQVVRLDVPSLRLGRQFLRRLLESGVAAAKVRVVANRHGQRRQITRQRAEEVLGLPILAAVPDDPATMNQALNAGEPLVRTSRRAAITRSFDVLAHGLNGRAAG